MNRTVRILASGAVQPIPPLYRNGAGVMADQDTNEIMDYTVDWTGWLGSDTISSSTWTATGVTLASAANTTKQASVRVSAVVGDSGEALNRVTTALGAVKDVTLRFNEIEG